MREREGRDRGDERERRGHTVIIGGEKSVEVSDELGIVSEHLLAVVGEREMGWIIDDIFDTVRELITRGD